MHWDLIISNNGMNQRKLEMNIGKVTKVYWQMFICIGIWERVMYETMGSGLREWLNSYCVAYTCCNLPTYNFINKIQMQKYLNYASVSISTIFFLQYVDMTNPFP